MSPPPLKDKQPQISVEETFTASAHGFQGRATLVHRLIAKSGWLPLKEANGTGVCFEIAGGEVGVRMRRFRHARGGQGPLFNTPALRNS